MFLAGAKAEISLVVGGADTAAEVGSGSLPVFATPTLAALVEKTACLCIDGMLDDGCTTVGTSLDIKHSAPTTVDVEVKCVCVLKEVDGRRLSFEATVTDNVGIIGQAKHERFVVKTESFMSKARSRAEENRG